MVNPEPQAPDLRTEIEEAVVRPLFAELRPGSSADGSVPEIVLRHRRRRAHDRLVDALVSRGSADVPAELREEVRALLRRWAAASFNDSFEPLEKLEIRCAREHDRIVAAESGDHERLLDVLEQEYQQRLIGQFGRIELRGLQTTHRILENLDEVYVPLHLEESLALADHEQGDLFALFRGKRELAEVLAEHRQILVIGSPGSGKSTLVAYLATRLAARLLFANEGHTPLPLVLTVRALKKPVLTAPSLAEHTGCEEQVVERGLRRGAFLLIDGLDEAPQALRERLVSSLQRFLLKYPATQVLATSRPVGAPGETEKRIEGLHPFRLVDLSRAEVDTFIDKWCLAAEKSIRLDEAQAIREARKASEDLRRRLSTSYSVQRIAVNPLLVTILCVVHRFLGRTIPEHRVTLYEKCTDALLYEWDRAKFPEGAAISHLDALAKRRLLMGIARTLHEEHAGEISEAEVTRHFSEILPDLGRPASDAKAIVEEIRDRSGLLVERQPGVFGFSHLTFQEYLCSLAFVNSKHFDDLVGHCAEPWWHEVIVLAAGNPGGGGGTISGRLLREKTDVAVFLAAQCLETETDMPEQIRRRVEKALRKLIPPKSFEEGRRLAAHGLVVAPILARSLQTLDPTGKWFSLYTLGLVDYDPAIPAIVQCVTDSSFMEGEERAALMAAAILSLKAENSAVARAALSEVAAKLPRQYLTALLGSYPAIAVNPTTEQILKDALRVALEDVLSPRAAAGTA